MQDLQKASASFARDQRAARRAQRLADGAGRAAAAGRAGGRVRRMSPSATRPTTPVLRRPVARAGAGRVLGLLGRTGSGKTTLTRLLLRLYDPTGGHDPAGRGGPARRRGCADLRARSRHGHPGRAAVPRHVRDNLTFFDPRDPRRAHPGGAGRPGPGRLVRRRCRDGLDTELAPGGGGLSAGEAQLLAFARVFLQDPGLVILDEASSRLDPATERADRAGGGPAAGRAHRHHHRPPAGHRASAPTTILILEDGRVVEYGRAGRAGRRSRLALRPPAADRAGGGAGMRRGRPGGTSWRLVALPARPVPGQRPLASDAVLSASPLVPGLIARAFFDALAGADARPAADLWSLVALLVGVGAGAAWSSDRAGQLTDVPFMLITAARCCGRTCWRASCTAPARARCPPRPARRSAASATT